AIIQKDVKRGELVWISLGVEQSKDLNTLQAHILFPAEPLDLIREKVKISEGWKGGRYFLRLIRDGEFNLILQVDENTIDVTGDKTLCLLPFKIADNAQPGTYKIEFNLDKSFALKRPQNSQPGDEIEAIWRGTELGVVTEFDRMVVYLRVIE
ncbi:MAG: hypothetical protein ACE5I1_23895, partial [bacterium]